MIVKISILDRDDGFLQVVGDVFRFELDPLLDGPGGDLGPVLGIDVGCGGGSEGLESIDLRYVKKLGHYPTGQTSRQDTGDGADHDKLEQPKVLLAHGDRVADKVRQWCGGPRAGGRRWDWSRADAGLDFSPLFAIGAGARF